MLKVLLPIDGSENSVRTVNHVISKAHLYKEPLELHLLNVQRAFPGTVKMVGEGAQAFHREEGMKALDAARKQLDAAEVKYTQHIGVGEPAEVIAQYVTNLGVEEVVMGYHGGTAVVSALLGSVATRVLNLVNVPVSLVK